MLIDKVNNTHKQAHKRWTHAASYMYSPSNIRTRLAAYYLECSSTNTDLFDYCMATISQRIHQPWILRVTYYLKCSSTKYRFGMATISRRIHQPWILRDTPARQHFKMTYMRTSCLRSKDTSWVQCWRHIVSHRGAALVINSHPGRVRYSYKLVF